MTEQAGPAPPALFNVLCRCECDVNKPGEQLCEHRFDGWREYETPGGGVTGEDFCTRCGMGSFDHAISMGL